MPHNAYACMSLWMWRCCVFRLWILHHSPRQLWVINIVMHSCLLKAEEVWGILLLGLPVLIGVLTHFLILSGEKSNETKVNKIVSSYNVLGPSCNLVLSWSVFQWGQKGWGTPWSRCRPIQSTYTYSTVNSERTISPTTSLWAVWRWS